jgi:hypothetical protein
VGEEGAAQRRKTVAEPGAVRATRGGGGGSEESRLRFLIFRGAQRRGSSMRSLAVEASTGDGKKVRRGHRLNHGQQAGGG